MQLTTSNYFDAVKKVKFNTLPETLRKTHEMTTRVGKAGIPWDNYYASAQIRGMIDKHFEVMGAVLDKLNPPKPEKPAKAEKPATAAKPAAAPKAAKAPKMPKVDNEASKTFKFAGGDLVEFEEKHMRIRGVVLPMDGGTARRNPDGTLSIWVPILKREFERVSTDLQLVTPAADRAKEEAPKEKAPKKTAKQRLADNYSFDWTPENVALGEQLRANAKFAVGQTLRVSENVHNLPHHESGFAGKEGEVYRIDVTHDGRKPYLLYLMKMPLGEGAQFPERYLSKVKSAAAPKAAKQPKQPKQPKAKKPKKVDMRVQVAHLSPEVVFFQKFLRLVDKPILIEQVQRLHANLEKSITKQQVRVSSKHADDLTEVARLVADLYQKMLDRGVGSIAKLEIDNPVVGRARAVVAAQRVATATNLLSRFIGMQGQEPDAKAVASLRTALHNEYEENPDGDHALAIGAAHAVLLDWKPGRPVRITKQQLSGLSGLMSLGCPEVPGKPCGCGPKKARR